MSGGGDPSAASRSRRKRKHPADASSVAKRLRPSDADAVTILRGVLDFRARTGANPTLTTMDSFYDSIRGSLPSPALTKDKVYNKLRHLRYKFQHSSPNPDPYAHQGGGGGGGGGGSDLVYELSADVWGGLPSVELKPKKIKKESEKNKIHKSDVKNVDGENVANEAEKMEREKEDVEQPLEEVEEEEEEEEEIRGIGTDSFPILIHEVTKYWKEKGLSTVSLEASLKLVRPSKARPVEEKWRKLMGKEMKSRTKLFEVLGSLLLS